ncbi:hypothetical protein ANABIO32_06460 [Rossellomorea marisflavi]|nr:hypothetical protein ANABIO32_06460 [Rossellomorea marisflavi]
MMLQLRGRDPVLAGSLFLSVGRAVYGGKVDIVRVDAKQRVRVCVCGMARGSLLIWGLSV